MDSQRYSEDSYQGFGAIPKLILAGRLDGFADGRPVSIVAEENEITFSAGDLAALIRLRCSGIAVLHLVGSALEFANIRVSVKLGWLGKVEVFPRPNIVIRLFMPQ